MKLCVLKGKIDGKNGAWCVWELCWKKMEKQLKVLKGSPKQ